MGKYLPTKKIPPGNVCRKGLKFPWLSGNIDSLAPTTGTFPDHWSHFLYLRDTYMDLQTNALNPLTHFLDILTRFLDILDHFLGKFSGLNYQYFHQI